MASNKVDAFFSLPALATKFTGDFSPAALDSVGEFLREIEITMDAFGVAAAELEERLGMNQVHDVFDFALAVLAAVPGLEEPKLDLQSFKRGKFFGKSRRIFYALALLAAVIGARSCFGAVHNHKLAARFGAWI